MRFVLPAVLGVAAFVTSCGFQDGVCVEAGPADLGGEHCTSSQKNTCEKLGGTFHGFADPKAFDKLQNTCSSLGYTAGRADAYGYVKP